MVEEDVPGRGLTISALVLGGLFLVAFLAVVAAIVVPVVWSSWDDDRAYERANAAYERGYRLGWNVGCESSRPQPRRVICPAYAEPYALDTSFLPEEPFEQGYNRGFASACASVVRKSICHYAPDPLVVRLPVWGRSPLVCAQLIRRCPHVA